MRRGDVCELKWSAVDLQGGMLTVKTSKTDASVEIPMFGPLRAVLEERKGDGQGFVFPEAAAMMQKNADGLSYRFKKIVAKALDTGALPPLPPPVPAAEIATEAVAALEAHVTDAERRKRMLDNFQRYAAGASFGKIVRATGQSKGTVSYDLERIELWTGKRFVRSTPGRHTKGEQRDIKSAIKRVTQVTREHGQLAASLRDWHALRTTFVTLALSAGVPMELVRRVTGHATVEVVLKHYFRPDRDQFKAALSGVMPKVLTGRAKRMRPADEHAALATKLAAGTATAKDKARMLELAEKLCQ
jgi:integrase